MIQSFNRGTRYLERGKYVKALACFKECAREADFKELWLNMGNVYRLLDRDREATDCYLRSASPNTPFVNGEYGHYPLALSNLGLLEYSAGHDDSAIEFYRAALDINHDHYNSIWNYAGALLRKYCSGEVVDLDLAWSMYEFRFYRDGAQTGVDKSLPRWDGVSKGKSIVVVCEQGIGDHLMWGRYVRCLQEYFDEIWIQVDKSLHAFFSDFKICDRVSETTATVSVPICSLARYFPPQPDAWLQDRYPKPKPSGEIIVEWAGSPTHSNDRNRSVSPHYFLELGLPNMVNIRPGAKVPRGIAAKPSGSWLETVDRVLAADLVISVDTSLVHLCGSLGVECWMLQPLKETDFRWGRSGVKNIWYPSVKVIRNPGSWKQVFATVKEWYANH
jgi:hypothetical protein